MTIIQTGANAWIEFLTISISIPDAASTTNGTATLTKPGTFLMGIVQVASRNTGDNIQNFGLVQLVQTNNAALVLGTDITQVRVALGKALGTSGATAVTCNILLFMRKSRG